MAEGGTRAGTVQLSRRLQALADLATPGNTVADVGCDHGFLSIYLAETGISPYVIASDVRRGPLLAARTHIEERGLSAYIESRLSDGLRAYRPGEAQTLICAGMGGRLMQRILMQDEETARSFRELILQPQSELRQFRVFLREQGFAVTDEEILCEGGKYYFCFRVIPGDPEREKAAQEDRLGDKYGRLLLRDRHPVLREYLEHALAAHQAVWEELCAHRGAEGANPRLERRLSEQQEEIRDLQTALAFY
ncbi:MAG: class I SAM-dependent methyltransferase [Muribaculum sp.]|nr:class I SAM-dependent methyltransferase [Muribaculum sp.]